MRILIVDDSLTVRKIVIHHLLKHGYDQIDEAVNGEEALALLQQHKYGCIFLDINMPIMDGFVVLKWLRAVSWRNDIHVVVMSTEVTLYSSKKIRDMGIDTVIAKPFSGDEFEKIAVSLLNVIDSKENSITLVYDGPILIIDDSMAMRNIIRKQLSNLNCLNVTEAVDGKDGLEKISEWAMLYEDEDTIGIVFLDLIMPNMDGLELIEVLEEKELLSKLKIVLLSGNIEMALDMLDGNSIKAALPKPFEHTAFVSALQPLIESTKAILMEESIPNIELFFDAERPKVLPFSLMSIHPENIDELDEYFLSVFESIAVGTSFPKERFRKIDGEKFRLWISSVYRPVLLIDPKINTYSELGFLYGRIEESAHHETAIGNIEKKDIEEYCKTVLIPIDKDYIDLITKIGRYKLAIKTLIERKNKLAQNYKSSPSSEIKEAYEKQEHDLLNYRNGLKHHEKLREELVDFLEIEYKGKLEMILKLHSTRMVELSNQMRAAFDRTLWRGMSSSIRFKAYCNTRSRHVALSTQSWLEYEHKREFTDQREYFENTFCTSILIVGFKDSESVRLREELKKIFPFYNVQAFSTWTIKNYSLPYEPSLLIFNRESKELNIEEYVKEAAEYYETLPNMVNTLIIYEGSIKSEELLGNNSLYNLKLKNYMKIPKNSSEFRLMEIKIKSLII